MALFGVHGLVRPKKCLTPPTLLETRFIVTYIDLGDEKTTVSPFLPMIWTSFA